MSLPLLPRDLQCYILSFADARTLLCGVGAASRALHALIASPPAWSLSRAADLTFAATHALLNDATVCRLASAWQSLSILDLSRTKHATPAAFQAVWRHCYALTELRVRACVHFGDACVPATPPKCASNMRILDISENQLLSASGLRRLCTHLPHLRTLNLSALRAVTTDVLAALPAVCARLEKLVLRRCPLVTNRGIGALATLAHLQRLDVSEVLNDSLCAAIRTHFLIFISSHSLSLSRWTALAPSDSRRCFDSITMSSKRAPRPPRFLLQCARRRYPHPRLR